MTKRILAIHDLSGFGTSSLMSVIPIMSRYGVQVTALPSAILSASTCYEGSAWLDTTDFMHRSIEHYIHLKRNFNAIYSGFLGSPTQVDTVREALRKLANEDTLVLIDPVMADDGKLYSCYDQSMVIAMRGLISEADIITPNFTEACLLADAEYHMHYTQDQLSGICSSLCNLGAKNIIITSVPDDQGQGSRVLLYSPEGGISYYECDYIPAFYPGTGDVFSSLLLALMLNGTGLGQAIPKAINFIHRAITFSIASGEDHREGLLLESLLWREDLR